MTLLLSLIDPQPHGRGWIIGRTPSGKVPDTLNLALRALMLFGPLACH